MDVQHVNLPVLHLDQDTNARDFDPKNYYYALNIRNGVGQIFKHWIRQNVNGNVLVSFDLPTGDNQVIGTLEDKAEKTIIYLVWNSLNNHQIFRYFPAFGAGNGYILKIAEGDFKFDRYRTITGINLVNGELLYWTDGWDFGSGIVGEAPRKINIVKALEHGKRREFHTYFPDTAFGAGFTYSMMLSEDGTGNLIGGIIGIPIYTSTGVDIETGIKEFAAAINTNNLTKQRMTAEACDCELKITLKQAGKKYTPIITVLDSLGQFPHKIHTVAQNFYPSPMLEEYFDRLKYPPNYAPTATYGIDITRKTNFVRNRVFQFAYRFIYDDKEESRWGAISKLIFDNQACGGGLNNFIDVNFTDARLQSQQSLAIIRGVEIAFREGNTGAWKLMVQLTPCEFGVGENIYRFYNDGIYDVIANLEFNPRYDSVPRICLAQEFAKNRLFDGGQLVGFDTIDCPNIKHSLSYEPVDNATGNWNITVRFKIYNRHLSGDYQTNQPIHLDASESDKPVFGGFGSAEYTQSTGTAYQQYLPEGGFIVYIAGMPYYAISKQVSAPVPYAQSNPIVYDSDTSGDRSDIRTAIEDQEIYSEATIFNVPPNLRALLRVASNFCSFGDVLGKGAIYDLGLGGTGYQKTSAPVAGIGGINGIQEQEILLGPGGGTYDFFSQHGYIYIEDLTNPQLLLNAIAISGYLLDADASGSATDLKNKGIRMECQTAHFKAFGVMPTPPIYVPLFSLGNDIRTDHNGFFYTTINSGLIGGTSVVRGRFVSNINQFANSDEIIKDYNQQKYTGGLGELMAGTLSTLAIDFHSTNELKQYIVFNNLEDISNYRRTTLRGRVVDQNGVGVSGVLVVYENNTRWEKTDANGNYAIVIWNNAFGEGARRTVDDIIFSYSGLCQVVFNTVDEYEQLQVIPINSSGYNKTTPFDVPDLLMMKVQGQVDRYLKRGGTYPYGIMYQDRGNRASTVARDTSNIIVIPFHTENQIYGKPLVDLEVWHRPPEWATHWVIVRTKNAAYNRYLNWVINSVKYVTRYNSDPNFPGPDVDRPQETTYSNGDATEIYLSLSNLKNYNDENTDSVLGFDNENQFVGFQPQKEDRVRLVLSETGAMVSDFYDMKIKGVRGDDIVIEVLENMPELKPGALLEFYTPKLQIEEQQFFEVSEIYPILDPHTDNRRHGKGVGPLATDQSVDLTTPARTRLATGDTYWRMRIVPVADTDNEIAGRYNYQIEDSSVSDFYSSKAEDIGRPNVEDDTLGEQYLKTLVSFSNIFIPGSKINGLSTVESGNRQELPREYQAIRKLQIVANTLKAIHELRTVSIYLNEAFLNNPGEAQILTVSKDVLGYSRPSESGEHGTRNPESVKEINGRIFFFDIYKGEVIRDSNDGQEVISDLDNKSFWSQVADRYRDVPPYLVKFPAVIDAHYEQYIISTPDVQYETFVSDVVTGEVEEDLEGDGEVPSPPTPIPPAPDPVTVKIPGFTFAYNYEKKGWESFYSYMPEIFCATRDTFVSFKEGKLWVHNVNPIMNNFYGVQYTSKIGLVINPHPMDNKVWLAMQQETSDSWEAVEITNGLGQLSRIRKALWIKKEKSWFADVLRDLNTPNTPFPIQDGNVMRSAELKILLENTSTEYVEFYSLITKGIISEKSTV